MMFHLANASQDNVLKQISYSKGPPFCLPEALSGPLLCLLIALLLDSPVSALSSVSLAKGWVPLRVRSNLAHFSVLFSGIAGP